jgi:hypothetical protein
MRFLFIVDCLTWLTIFVPSSVCAQNTVPEGEKGPSHLLQDKPPQEQSNPLPADKMNEPGSISTGQGETDSDDPRPRTRDDVIREILSGYSTEKHRPVLPR